MNGEILRGERFIVATGIVALIPDIKGLAETGYITNVEAGSLPKLPKRLEFGSEMRYAEPYEHGKHIHILGANAGELIAPVVYAIRFGLTVKGVVEAMLPYPTMAEVVRWAAAQF